MLRCKAYIESKLSDLYAPHELYSIQTLLWEHVLSYTPLDCLLKKDEEVNERDYLKLKHIVDQLAQGKPIQYVLTYAWFYELKFYVAPGVLIPRQETEELVAIILESYGDADLEVLDIGSGSGCIALSLKKHRPQWHIRSIDISEDALAIAQKNASLLELDVHFMAADIFSPPTDIAQAYDIIVSNPPYVRYCEKKDMHARVLDHEPALALFVTDKKPLIYYSAIFDFAAEYLKTNGTLFLEINEYLSKELQHEAKQKYAWRSILIKQDINGKDRMMILQK